jgi:hypothetical protein
VSVVYLVRVYYPIVYLSGYTQLKVARQASAVYI